MAEAVSIATSRAFLPASGAVQRRIALCLLTAVGTVSFIDRQVLAVLIEPIRAELHFTDTQFGLLTGMSFALFYAAVGLPAALLADRWRRVWLIGAACLLWSIFTGACGLARSFTVLAVARFGVGVGEAGGTAPSLSILSDHYPPERRSLAIGVYTANGPLGVFLGAALGGWAALQFGWRGAFIGVGALGLIVAPLLLILVREPARGAMDRGLDASAPAPSLADTMALFARKPSLRLLLIASGLSAFLSYGMLNWIPAFLMRAEHMPLRDLALWFAPAAGLSMGIGIFGGGALVSAFARRSARAYALVPALAALVLIVPFIAALLAPSWQLSLSLLIPPMICCTIYVAPALALVQNLTPPRARATASAFLLLVFNLVGLGGGPLVIGMISDAAAPSLGADSLRLGLACVGPAALLAAIAQYAMSRVVIADVGVQTKGTP
jgi:predicted MFS family arabinose efflux permease